MRGSSQHLIIDNPCVNGQCTKPDSRIDQGIVSLANLVIDALICNRGTRNSRCHQRLAIGPFNQVSWRGFNLFSWVGNWENDWAISMFGHLFNGSFGKGIVNR